MGDMKPGKAPGLGERAYIGQYQLIRLLGEGGMGRVYEAQERLSKRRVALKILREELSQSETARRMFRREMEILATLEHPNVVRSLASIEDGERLVTVLELLDGKTLRSELNQRGRLPWLEALAVVAQVARALVAAHGHQPSIVHRDLKPENIMVLFDGGVKVMDFGIAKVVQEIGQTNTQSAGTLQYMSPEQIDARHIDNRSDLYCLGLVFYELLSGRAPFRSASPRELLNLQCTSPPPELESAVRAGLPRGVENLLFHLLEKAPDDRPDSATAVLESLEPFLPALAPDIAKRSTEDQSSSPGSRNPELSDQDRTALLQDDREQVTGDEPTVPSPSWDLVTGPPKKTRDDTVALIDKAEAPSELPLALALLIIAALMVAAGGMTYWWRSSQQGVSEATVEARGPSVMVSPWST